MKGDRNPVRKNNRWTSRQGLKERRPVSKAMGRQREEHPISLWGLRSSATSLVWTTSLRNPHGQPTALCCWNSGAMWREGRWGAVHELQSFLQSPEVFSSPFIFALMAPSSSFCLPPFPLHLCLIQFLFSPSISHLPFLGSRVLQPCLTILLSVSSLPLSFLHSPCLLLPLALFSLTPFLLSSLSS